MKFWAPSTDRKEAPVPRKGVDTLRALIFPDGVTSWNLVPEKGLVMPPHPIDLETKGAGAEEIKQRVVAVFAQLNANKPVEGLELFVQAKEAGINPKCRIFITMPVEAFERMKLGEKLQNPAQLRRAAGNEIG